MRILLCGVAAIALSGCSWMGLGHQHGYGVQKQAYKANSNSGCCVGGKTLSRWNIETGVGSEFVTGGDVITGSQLHPAVAALGVTANNIKMKNAYKTGKRAELGGSYALNPNRKLTLQGFYAKADGKQVNWSAQGANTLRGTMSDYESYGVEAGLRQYAYPVRAPLVKSVRPYVEGKLGAAHVNKMRLENISGVNGPANPTTPSSLAMYDGGWVPTAAGLVGVETPVFNRFTMGVETGIRYMGKVKSDGSDMGVAGSFNSRYAGMNNGGERWSVPLTLRGRYRF